MKVQKGLMSLATLSLLSLSVACNSGGGGTQVSDRYQEGFNAGKAQGYDEGYDDGYADGDADGYARAKAFFQSADYNKGFADGRALGQTEGYDSGYDDGYLDGRDSVPAGGATQAQITAAYNDGYSDGQLDGYDAGYDDGMADGYDMGYDDGMADGYDLGYDDGFADGYDVGYDDGYFGLSVGQTKKLAGYANLLSMLHNDMFDYSKIAKPKVSAKGVSVNGRLLFSEASITNKDTLKRQAVVEQYLVMEMAKQVKGKFGLSAERSLKVAKAANHFRKYSTSRALTAEDTEAYATELIGAGVKEIESAYSNSLRGNLAGYREVLEKAAEKNETSAEKMSQIVAELFL